MPKGLCCRCGADLGEVGFCCAESWSHEGAVGGLCEECCDHPYRNKVLERLEEEAMEGSGPACACNVVERKRVSLPPRHLGEIDVWRCTLCQRRFVPHVEDAAVPRAPTAEEYNAVLASENRVMRRLLLSLTVMDKEMLNAVLVTVREEVGK